jgi:RND family efflux transporter MFP subunit
MMGSSIMTLWRRPARAAVVGLGVILIAVPAMAQQSPPPARVSTAEVTRQLLSPEIQVPGTVISKNDSRISSEILGRIVWVAEVGAAVKEGDVVARIDDTNFATALTQAEANVKSLEADLLYRIQDVKRIEELAATRNTPVSRLEQAISQRDMVKQNVIQAKAALKRAQRDLARTEVRAPFPGRVVARLSQMGEFASPGALLVRLVDTQHLEVRAQAPISSAPHLKEGMEVKIADENRQIRASLRAVIPVGDEVSRMMEIRLELDPDIWVIGSAVRVSLPSAASRQVIAVPRDALILRANMTYVYRINAENKAERIIVSTGIASGTLIEISGPVSVGDRVVVRGGERLREGQDVVEGEAS